MTLGNHQRQLHPIRLQPTSHKQYDDNDYHDGDDGGGGYIFKIDLGKTWVPKMEKVHKMLWLGLGGGEGIPPYGHRKICIFYAFPLICHI